MTVKKERPAGVCPRGFLFRPERSYADAYFGENVWAIPSGTRKLLEGALYHSSYANEHRSLGIQQQ